MLVIALWEKARHPYSNDPNDPLHQDMSKFGGYHVCKPHSLLVPGHVGKKARNIIICGVAMPPEAVLLGVWIWARLTCLSALLLIWLICNESQRRLHHTVRAGGCLLKCDIKYLGRGNNLVDMKLVPG